MFICVNFSGGRLRLIGKIGISKVTAKVFGQGTRGGGEYLSVANAWESASKSIEYFTQSYGLNSYQAFKKQEQRLNN